MTGVYLTIPLLYILRKLIEGYLDSVPSLTFNTIKTLLIMHAFHSSLSHWYPGSGVVLDCIDS